MIRGWECLMVHEGCPVIFVCTIIITYTCTSPCFIALKVHSNTTWGVKFLFLFFFSFSFMVFPKVGGRN